VRHGQSGPASANQRLTRACDSEPAGATPTALSVEPGVDVVGPEPHVVADFEVRNSTLGDKTAHVTDRRAEVLGELLDAEERTVGTRGLFHAYASPRHIARRHKPSRFPAGEPATVYLRGFVRQLPGRELKRECSRESARSKRESPWPVESVSRGGGGRSSIAPPAIEREARCTRHFRASREAPGQPEAELVDRGGATRQSRESDYPPRSVGAGEHVARRVGSSQWCDA